MCEIQLPALDEDWYLLSLYVSPQGFDKYERDEWLWEACAEVSAARFNEQVAVAHLLRLCLLMLGEAALAWALSCTLLGVSICEQHGVTFGIIMKRLSNLI